MTIRIDTIIKNRNEFKKQIRVSSQDRTNKRQRARNRAERAEQRAKFNRMEQYSKYLTYRDELDFDSKRD